MPDDAESPMPCRADPALPGETAGSPLRAPHGGYQVNAFLTHIAVELHVSASTQNQALSALLFLYRKVLERDLNREGLIRARTRPRLPVVMTVEELRAVLERLEGVEALVAGVLCTGEGFACSQRLPRSGWRHCGYGCTILMFSARRSRCAMARAGRIGARCCLREWERNSKLICRRCVACIARTLPRAMGGCASPTPWGESIPMHR